MLFTKNFINEHERTLIWAVIIIAFILIGWIVYIRLPMMGVDWHNAFRPAALQVFSLMSPYNIKNFHSPPWAVIPIMPMALLPSKIGFAVNFSISLAVTAFVAYRMGAKPAGILLLLYLIQFFLWQCMVRLTG